MCVYVRERCVYASVCMCVREIRLYVAGVPFVPLPVSVFILLHVHGPDHACLSL
jgi:hypothetical protein